MEKVYQKCGLVQAFKGKQRESHRAFVFCADLLGETAAEPWAELSDSNLDRPEYKTMFEWMLSKASPFDTLILCDGRSRKARRIIEDALAARPHVVETWVIFKGGTSKMAGRSVTFASSNQEVIMIALPCARTSLTVKERASYNACGEERAH